MISLRFDRGIHPNVGASRTIPSNFTATREKDKKFHHSCPTLSLIPHIGDKYKDD